MEVYFNELSLRDMEYDDIDTINRVYKELKKKNAGICRIEVNEQKMMFDRCREFSNWREISNLFYAFFQAPFENGIKEDDLDFYYGHKWFFEEKTICGLAFADIMESAAYSLNNETWHKEAVSITRDGDNREVRNVFDEDSAKIFVEWLSELEPIQLIRSEITPCEKPINLRGDHGIDILNDFCDRIVNSPYVEEVVNSLPFNPHCHRFIKDIRKEGIIHMVLHWTDEGFGVAVKTTGRNRRETEEIARVLEREYGKM